MAYSKKPSKKSTKKAKSASKSSPKKNMRGCREPFTVGEDRPFYG